MPEPRVAYRPDVEGLRAVAILLVVAAHARIPGFEGGFIGVDVFFVISGYLITALLVAERRSTGRIDFGRFYARRFRRLLPALLLMLAISAVAAWILLPLSNQPYQAKAGAAALAWLSNLYFAFEHIDYFGLNLALGGTASRAIADKHVSAVLLPLIVVAIPAINLTCWLLGKVLPSWPALTAGYCAKATRP